MSSVHFAPMWMTMPDGTRRPASVRADAPKTLVVSADSRQVAYWTKELRLLERMLPFGARDPAIDAHAFTGEMPDVPLGSFAPPVRWLVAGMENRAPHLRGYDEVWFVGTWAAVDADALARVYVGALESGAHVTYVCDAYGQVIAPELTWTCWDAPSTGKRTKWHLVAPRGFVGDGDYKSMCGLPLTALRLEADGYWEDERYGPPRDACGICAHDAWHCVVALRAFTLDESHETRMEYWAERLDEQRRDLGRLANSIDRRYPRRGVARVGVGSGRAGNASTAKVTSWAGRDPKTDPRNPYPS